MAARAPRSVDGLCRAGRDLAAVVDEGDRARRLLGRLAVGRAAAFRHRRVSWRRPAGTYVLHLQRSARRLPARRNSGSAAAVPAATPADGGGDHRSRDGGWLWRAQARARAAVRLM